MVVQRLGALSSMNSCRCVEVRVREGIEGRGNKGGREE